MPTRTAETDLSTALVSLADRLRVDATALRGLALDASDGDTVDGRIKHGLAADLDSAAAGLDALRSALCRPCALLDARAISAVGEVRRAFDSTT